MRTVVTCKNNCKMLLMFFFNYLLLEKWRAKYYLWLKNKTHCAVTLWKCCLSWENFSQVILLFTTLRQNSVVNGTSGVCFWIIVKI